MAELYINENDSLKFIAKMAEKSKLYCSGFCSEL